MVLGSIPGLSERRRRLAGRWALAAGWAAALVWGVSGIEVSLERVAAGVPTIARIVGLMFPPDLSLLGRALAGMVESFQIAVLGTSLGAVLAIPLSFLAARNMSRSWGLSLAGKEALNAIRTFPELILAIFFVAAFGPGALAGLMAVGLHSVGMLGKLYADVVEEIDPGPVEAVRAAGAGSLQTFAFAVVPQVLPEFVATALYRFEINLRASTVLGLVGAGGIGVLLLQALQFRRWAVVSVALLVVVTVVTAVDAVSGAIRRRIV